MGSATSKPLDKFTVDLATIWVNKHGVNSVVTPKNIQPYPCLPAAYNKLRTLLKLDYKQDKCPTLLHIASALGNVEVIDYLIGCGADINLHSSLWPFPFEIACLAKQWDALRLLRKAGSNASSRKYHVWQLPLQQIPQGDELKTVGEILLNPPVLEEDITVEDMVVTSGNKYKRIKTPASLLQPATVKRRSLKVPGAKCFTVDGIMSKTECDYYINKCEKIGWKSLKKQFPKDYRSNEQLIILSDSLANSLWKRLEGTLTRSDVQIRPMGFGNGGLWRPSRLNECFKFGKYTKGGSFNKHIDGPWVPRHDECSVFTVVVYLNDDFEGGNTVFYDGDEEAVKVSPKAGTALVFNHNVLHQGDPVIKGVKYIFRTEIMFMRVDQSATSLSNRFTKDPGYLKTVFYYNKAYDLEEAGDTKGFIETYRKAIKLQHEAIDVSDFEQLDSLPLPIELYCMIFEYLSPKEVVSVFATSRVYYIIARDGSIWSDKYKKRWNNAVGGLRAINAKGQLKIEPAVKDWYSVYKQRSIVEGLSKSKGLEFAVFDLGSYSIKGGLCTTRTDREQFQEIKAIVAKAPRIFDLHTRRIKWSRYYIGEDIEQNHPKEIQHRTTKEGNVVDGSTLPEFIAGMFCEWKRVPNHHPLLIAEPPTGWSKKHKMAIKNILFITCNIPSISIANAATLILLNHGLTNGVVISLGHEVRCVAPVYCGAVIKDAVVIIVGEDYADAVKSAIEKCASSIQEELWNAIVLSGRGITSEMRSSLTQDLKKAGISFNIRNSSQDPYDVVRGGLLLSKMPGFHKFCVESPGLALIIDIHDKRIEHTAVNFYSMVTTQNYWYMQANME